MRMHDIEIEVQTTRLTSLLESQRKRHLAEYESAMTVWRARMLEECKRIAGIMESDGWRDSEDIGVVLHKPISCEEEYDRMIKMVDLHAGETMTLTGGHLRQIQTDDFDWIRRAKMVNSTYSLG